MGTGGKSSEESFDFFLDSLRVARGCSRMQASFPFLPADGVGPEPPTTSLAPRGSTTGERNPRGSEVFFSPHFVRISFWMLVGRTVVGKWEKSFIISVI